MTPFKSFAHFRLKVYTKFTNYDKNRYTLVEFWSKLAQGVVRDYLGKPSGQTVYKQDV